MDTDFVDTLLSAGPLGAIIVAMGIALWRQTTELRASQEARVSDAHKVAETLIEMNNTWNRTVSELTTVVKELKLVVESVTRGNK